MFYSATLRPAAPDTSPESPELDQASATEIPTYVVYFKPPSQERVRRLFYQYIKYTCISFDSQTGRYNFVRLLMHPFTDLPKIEKMSSHGQLVSNLYIFLIIIYILDEVVNWLCRNCSGDISARYSQSFRFHGSFSIITFF